jgi:SAM-dependent methyltransferase
MFDPSQGAAIEDFQFPALQEATNYRDALCAEFQQYLKGDVLEIGAGVGQVTECLVSLPAIERLVSVEPNPNLCARLRNRFNGRHQLIEGTVTEVPAELEWDAILSVNVLEHIRDDQGELQQYGRKLKPKGGTLCLFVPARPEIYAPIDKDFGHYRRYTRRDLKGKLHRAGFQVLKLSYYNSIGYAAWWLNFCVLKKRSFESSGVRFFDRTIFPVVHALESKFVRPPIGQSLIAIARQPVAV